MKNYLHGLFKSSPFILTFILSLLLTAGVLSAQSAGPGEVKKPVGSADDEAVRSKPPDTAEISFFVDFEDDSLEDSLVSAIGDAGASSEIYAAQMTPEVLVSEGAIDYEKIMSFALSGSRDIKKIGLNIKNTENSLLIDEIAYKPNFSVSIDNDHNYNYSLSQKVADLVSLYVSKKDNSKLNNDSSVNYSMSLDLRRLDNSDLTLARLSCNRELLGYVTARENFKLRVIRQFYDLVLAVEEFKVLSSSCDRWREMLDYARSKYELGLANKIDYLNAEVNLASAQNALLQQEQNIQTQKEQFFDLIGFKPASPENYENSLRYNISFEQMATSEIESILSNKDKKCVREDVEAEKVSLRMAHIKYMKAKKHAAPRLNLNIMKTEYENAARESDFSSSLTYRFNMGRQENAVSEWVERNNYELKKIALDELETGVVIEQRDALRKIEYIEKAYEIASKSLRQAYENFEFSRLSFQKGLISNIDLRDAQDKLTGAKRSVVSLIIQHKLACHKFYFAMGKDL
ncbi:MAG TPA: TolC family protein [Candidatus Wallbacteria bacterium]|nr:TolC family protein [Candidatus Wallbacteria bacterium]